jgi:uncharacterized 2Fe-2S/4Fe-4S cluster protein (DUF4445 family)
LERQSVRVIIRPGSREVWVVSGSTIKEALLAAAVPISMPCGGHGRCGRCVVTARGDLSAMTAEERERLPGRGRSARLACLARIEGSATVTVPASSRVTVQKIVSRGTTSGSYRFRPGVIKVFLGKKQPRTLGRLKRDYGIGLEDIALSATDPALMEPELRKDHQWRLGLHSNATAVVAKGEVMGLEAGDTTRECFGAAIDVGTNTVVCSLVDLTTGRELGSASTINPQVMHGDDVISRIRFAKTAGGLQLLRAEIVNLINGLLDEIAGSLRIDRRRIYLVSAVGNTAMQHILAGISPVDLGRAPYRARMVAPVETPAARVGISANRACRLVMPPVLGGFVGGDLVALVVSQSLVKARRRVLAVDLGTNGEIVLAFRGRIAACSTAAGPAFEGERISGGVRAIQGAVEGVMITRKAVRLETIGGGKPVGLCGSGLLGAIAELVRTGVIDPSGRMRPRDEIKGALVAERVIEGEGGREFVLSRRPRITLRQGDIREVQLGKAAIGAGIKVLARVVGIGLDEIDEVLVAGSFGSALKPSTVRTIGLVPPEVRGKIRIIGNSAIEGAKIFLVSDEARSEAEAIAARAEHVELFSRPEFREEFYAAMRFPEA